MKVYLAARYSRREELLAYSQQLTENGFAVTSRWLGGSHRITSEDFADTLVFQKKRQFAREDVEDVLRADVLVYFSEQYPITGGAGGRHVEVGIALASKIPVILVGQRENVFHYLEEIDVKVHWPEALDFLLLLKGRE